MFPHWWRAFYLQHTHTLSTCTEFVITVNLCPLVWWPRFSTPNVRVVSVFWHQVHVRSLPAGLTHSDSLFRSVGHLVGDRKPGVSVKIPEAVLNRQILLPTQTLAFLIQTIICSRYLDLNENTQYSRRQHKKKRKNKNNKRCISINIYESPKK